MRAAQVWGGVSLGVLFLALAAMVHYGRPWQWIFVVFAGMSLLNALAKGRWRWLPHPLLWGAGLSWSYAVPPGDPRHVGGWTMFLALCGASVIVAFLVGLVPRRRRTEGPRRPGEGVVVDIDVVDRE